VDVDLPHSAILTAGEGDISLATMQLTFRNPPIIKVWSGRPKGVRLKLNVTNPNSEYLLSSSVSAAFLPNLDIPLTFWLERE